MSTTYPLPTWLSSGAATSSIEVQAAGVLIGTRPTLNFVSGALVVDNGGSNRIDITVVGGGGTVDIQENGSTVVVGATILNFQNGVIAASGGGTTGTVNLDYGATGGVITIQPDATADGGTSVQVARVDHRHAIAADAPVGVAQANSEGTSVSFARADHIHNHGSQPLGGGLNHALVTPDPGGVAGFMSPADKEKLNASGILTSTAPTQIDIGDSAVVGVATTVARADHQHALPIPTVISTIDPDDSAAIGASPIPAREDHQHGIDTATAITITDATNGEGVSTSFARADHGHAHGDRAGGMLHAAATTLVNGFLSAADKTKLDAVFTSEMVPIFTGLHSANGAAFITVARQVVNFDKLGTSITFRWNQVAVPANNAEVRIQNITDATTLGSLSGISTTGLKSFTVTNPTGTKLIYLEHREVTAGAGTSDIEGGILETA